MRATETIRTEAELDEHMRLLERALRARFAREAAARRTDEAAARLDAKRPSPSRDPGAR